LSKAASLVAKEPHNDASVSVNPGVVSRPPATLGNIDRPMAGPIRSQTIPVIRAVQNFRPSSSSRPEDPI
jgi:hypothetical protein